MIKRFLPDIFIAGIILALAFFIAAGFLPSNPPAMSARPEKPVAKPDSTQQKKIWTPPVAPDTALKQRNLFSETGSYVVGVQAKKAPVVLPENPYTLVAVLLGKDRKAVFRNYTGEVQALTIGKTLMDGAVLTAISPRSVKLKKGKEIKEMNLFDVHLMSAEPAKR